MSTGMSTGRNTGVDGEGRGAAHAPGPRLVGVGVGPGDPELVTVKGVNALRAADAVVVPVMEGGGTGRAEATVLHYVGAARVVRVVFALNERSDRARREAAWDAAGRRVAELLRGVPAASAAGTTGATGEEEERAPGAPAHRSRDGGHAARESGAAKAPVVAFATIGDPNVYSTFTYLAQTVSGLVPGLRVETVPGVTAMQDLAARSGAVLTEGTEPLTLVPVTAGSGVLKAALEGPGTVVAYKFGRLAAEVAEALRATGRTQDAVWGSALGLPDESIRTAAELDADAAEAPGDAPGGAPLPYLSTLIAPARRESRGGKL